MTEMTAAERAAIDEAAQFLQGFTSRMGRILRGKEDFLRLLTAALTAGGHVLLEDVPGLGKTTVAKTIAGLITSDGGAGFRRIQFTPDLLPYDITGVDVYDQGSGSFRFLPGPVFTSILLADEINRATPKVQSALLEVMAERQVTVGNETYSLNPFFFVIATQNPVEMEGTYPLPLAEIDRFMMRLSVGYPDEESEISILCDEPGEKLLPGIEAYGSDADFLKAAEAAESVFCHSGLIRTIVRVCRATREHPALRLGLSPRAGLHMVRVCRSLALLEGRSYICDQDLLDLAPAVWSHRLGFRQRDSEPEKLLRELILKELENRG